MFTKIPIVLAGAKHLHADGLMVTSQRGNEFTAPDGLVGMYLTFDDIDAIKVAADAERRLQVEQGRRPAAAPKLAVVR